MTRRQNILAEASDAALYFIAYDRKEDDGLPLGAIEEAVEKGEIKIDEIVSAFRRALFEHGDFPQGVK